MSGKVGRLGRPQASRAVSRGLFLSFIAGALIALATPDVSQAAATRVTSIRIWPAADYTRLTLESETPIIHRLFTLENPERVVLDLDDVELGGVAGLGDKIGASDPYVKSVRIGRFKPGTLRLVFDLKAPVKPQVFTLAPVGDYRHRLVLDFYPVTPPDPLLAFLDRHAERGADHAAPRPDVETAASIQEAPASARKGRGSIRPITVAIDAGHGGEDPGARGRGGTYEKHVTLAIAQKLKERIDREPGMRAVLIRDGDYFIPLQVRVQKARRVNADLFVSVHADAFITPHARGSSVFALSERGATSAAARWLAKHENDADLIGGVNLDVRDPYLKQTLLDLSQTATINDSLKLARAVLAELGGINTLHKGDVEQAGFAVLKAPDIPSVLVETAFITNPDEEAKLRSDGYQAKLADAVFQGIKRYFAKNPPLSRDRLVLNP